MEKSKNKSREKNEKIVGTFKQKSKLSISPRGRIFEGTVTKKFPKRVAIEFERMIKIRKYERYTKARTKIHARLPESMENEIKIGDYIKIQECRPLSKLIHFIVIEKIKDKENIKENKK